MSECTAKHILVQTQGRIAPAVEVETGVQGIPDVAVRLNEIGEGETAQFQGFLAKPASAVRFLSENGVFLQLP